MRGHVPQRDACFQSLTNGAAWNMTTRSGSGREEQKCAWVDGMNGDPAWNTKRGEQGAVIIFF